MKRREFLKKVGSSILFASLSRYMPACDNKTSSGNNDTNPSPYKSSVYISKATSYNTADYASLKNSIGNMVETLYHKKPFFQYGESISIKPNLVSTVECLGLPAIQTYISHPIVSMALGEVLKDLGAGKIYIIEGSTTPSDTMQVFHETGYDDVGSYLGAELIDLNKPDPYKEFYEVSIHDGLVYKSIKAHRHLFETDCLVSLAKLKCHNSAGISFSLKNLIGLLPVREYGLYGTGARLQYVHDPASLTQIPYNIIDLARLFPIDFTLIDGISSIERGEGPWVQGVSIVNPELLIAGDDPVAVDSICTSVIGFNPQSDYPEPPFVRCYNHIKIAAMYNLGTNNLDEIEVLGEKISDILYPYSPPT
jgi:uncharacterized protein (DUF362 family)